MPSGIFITVLVNPQCTLFIYGATWWSHFFLICCRDGRIKVIGGDNIEGLFISSKQLPYKYLEVRSLIYTGTELKDCLLSTVRGLIDYLEWP